MERRGRRILHTGVVASTKARQHHSMWLICEAEDTAPYCSLWLSEVLFRGFYLGQARVPDFVTEKSVSLKRSWILS